MFFVCLIFFNTFSSIKKISLCHITNYHFIPCLSVRLSIHLFFRLSLSLFVNYSYGKFVLVNMYIREGMEEVLLLSKSVFRGGGNGYKCTIPRDLYWAIGKNWQNKTNFPNFGSICSIGESKKCGAPNGGNIDFSCIRPWTKL